MGMVGNDLTARILERALSAATLRQRVLAHNIANINTPGFKRSRVEFEQHLADALERGERPDEVHPAIVREKHTIGRPDGNNVDIEREMTEMAVNQIYYAALARSISDHFARLRMVIHEGRR